MKSAWKVVSGVLMVAVLATFLFSRANVASSKPLGDDLKQQMFVSEPVMASLSPAVRDLPDVKPTKDSLLLDREINPRQNMSVFLNGPVNLVDDGTPDALLPNSINQNGVSPSPLLTFDGVSYATGGTGSPPDTSGDVGPNHYVQSVNGSFQIFNKSGAALTAVKANSSLWAGFGGPCQTRNDGDPVVLYDQLADRWMISQFTVVSPYMICVAVSTTGDPTGTYYRYGFNVGSSLPDYFKFGVWPNAYYMSANESTYTAYAFDRTKMLTGAAATFIKFTGQTNFLLPADLDGSTLPSTAPGIFYTFKDNSYHGGSDRLEVFELSPNFATPASSTFTLVKSVPVTAYTYTVCNFFNLKCVPQRGTAQKLDALSEWPMFRFAYRKFGSYQSLVGNFTIDVGSDRAGIRWFELRNTGTAGSGWSLYQEGTYAPGTDHRFVGSIAQDKQGNIALAYTVSSGTVYPSLRYTTRVPGDPLGTLNGGEMTLFAGTGSQTSTHNRWGDYSQLSVDPTDDCTFWFTSEYFSTSGGSWKTRIGKFKMAGCL